MATRVVLVSCVKTKGPAPALARDLYTSPLFRGMRRYAERHAAAWYILSAKYGVVRPDEVIAPYEQTLKKMAKRDRAEWADRVQRALLDVLPPGATVVFLAGEWYREELIPFLEQRGFTVSVPMTGLAFGPQLRWLKEQETRAEPTSRG